jgi:hypothetical protein
VCNTTPLSLIENCIRSADVQHTTPHPNTYVYSTAVVHIVLLRFFRCSIYHRYINELRTVYTQDDNFILTLIADYCLFQESRNNSTHINNVDIVRNAYFRCNKEDQHKSVFQKIEKQIIWCSVADKCYENILNKTMYWFFRQIQTCYSVIIYISTVKKRKNVQEFYTLHWFAAYKMLFYISYRLYGVS